MHLNLSLFSPHCFLGRQLHNKKIKGTWLLEGRRWDRQHILTTVCPSWWWDIAGNRPGASAWEPSEATPELSLGGSWYTRKSRHKHIQPLLFCVAAAMDLTNPFIKTNTAALAIVTFTITTKLITNFDIHWWTYFQKLQFLIKTFKSTQ